MTKQLSGDSGQVDISQLGDKIMDQMLEINLLRDEISRLKKEIEKVEKERSEESYYGY